MNNDKLYQILGRITYSYGRIDFLLSYMATALQIAMTPYEFFARMNFDKKIKDLHYASKTISDQKTRQEFIDWLDQLDKLRQERNTVIHSLILKNSKDNGEFRLYNYKQKDGQVTTEIYDYTTDDFEHLDSKFLEVHNSGNELFKKLQAPKTS